MESKLFSLIYLTNFLKFSKLKGTVIVLHVLHRDLSSPRKETFGAGTFLWQVSGIPSQA